MVIFVFSTIISTRKAANTKNPMKQVHMLGGLASINFGLSMSVSTAVYIGAGYP